ncbi:hypothetical protein D9615_002223 [Tricholomella constricta]|uniref:Cdc23 domain-containing protein n=1 Tax=Tricholomella constricta TaxID=117010 RepID=A0A8H5M9P3_9AGAR|nr:hypothetical protein D9615_002223 [Tricholomella constricta]
MATASVVDVQMVAELRSAIKECSERGLSVASKWASELHLAIPINKRRAAHSSSTPASGFSTSTPARTRSPPASAPFVEESPVPTQILIQASLQLSPARHPHAPLLLAQPADVRAMEADLEAQEEDVLVTARAISEYLQPVHRNHYSLRAEHEKAVKYFRRATQLDRTYLSAWTLMGHEYVEMKNSHAAIEAYRRAVDVNRKDYRAWYGLGQAYELLSMHHYALHYYQHATALRPYDVRLWQAQGMCYEEIGRLREAVECLKHALIPADPHEITINLKLAKLHRALEEPSEAVAYHRRVVEVCQADLRPIQDYAKSSLEVAEYQIRIPNGDLFLARDYLERVAGSNAEDVGRAAELLKTVKAAIQARATAEAEGRAQKMQEVANMTTESVGEEMAGNLSVLK